MSPADFMQGRYLETVRDAVDAALRWHARSKEAAVAFEERVKKSQAAIRRSRELLQRLEESNPTKPRPTA